MRLPENLAGNSPCLPWCTQALTVAYENCRRVSKQAGFGGNCLSRLHASEFADIIEDPPEKAHWYSLAETRRLLDMMSGVHRAKLQQAQMEKRRIVGTLYRRTRKDDCGRKVQRAEIRFDISGCLRTPAGGSSRQVVLVVESEAMKARLISSRETARLMGLPDTYKLPKLQRGLSCHRRRRGCSRRPSPCPPFIRPFYLNSRNTGRARLHKGRRANQAEAELGGLLVTPTPAPPAHRLDHLTSPIVLE